MIAMLQVYDIVQPSPAGPGWIHYAVTLASAMLMYVFALYKGFNGATDFLRRAFPSRSDRFYVWADLITVTLAGTFFGIVLYSPTNLQQSLAAGVGWVGALQVLMNREDPHRPNNV